MTSMLIRTRTSLVDILLAVFLGWWSMALPVLLGNRDHHTRGFLPIVGEVVEGITPTSIVLLYVVSAVLGFRSRVPVLLLGPAFVFVFPAWSAMDMARGGDHGLFPIEWLVYAFYAVIATSAAGSGRMAWTIRGNHRKRSLQLRPRTPSSRNESHLSVRSLAHPEERELDQAASSVRRKPFLRFAWTLRYLPLQVLVAIGLLAAPGLVASEVQHAAGVAVLGVCFLGTCEAIDALLVERRLKRSLSPVVQP